MSGAPSITSHSADCGLWYATSVVGRARPVVGPARQRVIMAPQCRGRSEHYELFLDIGDQIITGIF